MVGSIDPRCETLRGTHWPKKGRLVVWNSRRGSHLGQRSTDRINRPDIWMQAIRSDRQKTLVARGPSTYGSLLSQGRQRLDQQIAEVAPFRVIALNQLDLPVTLPLLQLLLPADCLVRAIIGFDVNKAIDAVGFDKGRTFAIAVFRQTLLQGIGHPDIQGPMSSARENVDEIHARNTKWLATINQRVVPAKAGTHTPRPLFRARGQLPSSHKGL